MNAEPLPEHVFAAKLALVAVASLAVVWRVVRSLARVPAEFKEPHQ